ncbi:COX15/CtaA family protein [Vicingaceae bacterium]|nr:COX15/CtaA family protein [Vicingaceae bacterium]MDB4062370.1 COX15/CtaA family protein [Vicingaceae bacterium]
MENHSQTFENKQLQNFSRKKHKAIIIWLLTGCVLIFIMVAIGGLTRLTHSGLSMVEWNLFGSNPPSSQTDWEILFNKYKQFPEYQLVNFNFSLEEFKSIFYWEYGHRMFGRLIGLVFIIPFFWFLIRKKFSKSLMPKLVLLLFMGGFQGLLGWYMVKSGLKANPDVSHYRLAMHLTTAFLTFGYTFWVALGLIYPRPLSGSNHALKRGFQFLFPVVVLQIIWGAYVAGLNAGKVYNAWPKMGEKWIADSVTAMQPWYLNFIEGLAGVQFIHRYLAYLVFAFILFLFWKAKKMQLSSSQNWGVNSLAITVGIQFVLGVIALLYAVPVSLGLLHQLGAFVLLGSTIYSLHRFRFNNL